MALIGHPIIGDNKYQGDTVLVVGEEGSGRSTLLREVAQRLGGPRAEFATQVERLIVDTLAEVKPGRQLYANVEFYAGVVMEAAGLPPELFTPTFAASRVLARVSSLGWGEIRSRPQTVQR